MAASSTSTETRSPRPFGRLETAPALLAEVLSLPARHITSLPLATRFVLEGYGFARQIVLDPSGGSSPDHDRIVFAGDEVRALLVGVQSERLWPADLKGFCLRKLHEPDFQVTEGLALAGAQPDATARGSFGSVLRWLDLELVGIELETTWGAARGASRAA